MEKDILVINSEAGPIYFEVDAIPKKFSGKVPVSITQDADFLRSHKSFEEAMLNVEVMYKAMHSMFNKIKPDEFNIEVGLKFNVKTGLFVFTTGSEIDFKINLKWDLNKRNNPNSDKTLKVNTDNTQELENLGNDTINKKC